MRSSAERAGLDGATTDAIVRLYLDALDREDDVRRAEKELDDLTHKYVTQVDELLKHKEAELLEV